MTAAKPFRSGH